MKQYVCPSVELMSFEKEIFMTGSTGCNCHYDITNQNMGIDPKVECEGETGGADENPFGIDAPKWTFG